jgi:hypothetical protein
VEDSGSVIAVEAKSGQTVAGDFIRGLRVFDAVLDSAGINWRVVRRVVFGGATRQRRTDVDILPWSSIDRVTW